jgi:hypothetical protein
VEIGVALPQTDLGGDPITLRDTGRTLDAHVAAIRTFHQTVADLLGRPGGHDTAREEAR